MENRIPDAEFEVLKLLWSLGESTVKEIREALRPTRDHATISTLLKRLESRGYVKRKKPDTGREFLFVAVAKPDKTRNRLVKNLLNKAFGGSGVEMVQALFQTTPPTPAEIESLEKLLEQLKNSKRKTK